MKKERKTLRELLESRETFILDEPIIAKLKKTRRGAEKSTKSTKSILTELDASADKAREGVALLEQEKVTDALKLLSHYSGEVKEKCALCGEVFRKAALQTSLAATSKNLGEEDWETHLRRAKETLNRFSNEVIPKLKKDIEA